MASEAWWLAAVALLCACEREVDAREAAAERAASATVDELTAEVKGGVIVDSRAAADGRPLRLRIRATSFDLQIILRDAGCAARDVDVFVDNVAAGAAWTWQSWRGALTPAAQAERQCCGSVLTTPQSLDHPDWTPLGPARAFAPGDVQAPAAGADRAEPETCEEADIQGVDTDADTEARERATSRCWRLRLTPSTDTAAIGAVLPAVQAPAVACADYATLGGGPARRAPFILVQRAAWRPPAARLADGDAGLRFAVFGNHAGVGRVRRAVVAAVSARVPTDELRFALVTGDLAGSGASGSLDAAVADLDALPIPWFATVGERDVEDASPAGLVARFGPLTDAFDVASEASGIAFRVVLLDSADGGLSAGAFRHLDAWLDDPLAPATRLVATHIPPFEPHGLRGKAFKSRAEAARLVAALHRGGVTDVFTSHLAIFQRQRVGDVTLWHSGGGGAPMESIDDDRHHFLIVTVNSSGAISVERVDL